MLAASKGWIRFSYCLPLVGVVKVRNFANANIVYTLFCRGVGGLSSCKAYSVDVFRTDVQFAFS